MGVKNIIARGKRTRRCPGHDLGLFSSLDIEKKYRKSLPGGVVKAKASDYSHQLMTKQILMYTYGLRSRTLKRAFDDAARKRGSAGENLLIGLESRLDNAVYRLGLASTRAEARQMVVHKHIIVNGRLLNCPSYQVHVGDVIGVKDSVKNHVRVRNALDQKREIPQWLTFDDDKLSGEISSLPDVKELLTLMKVNLVVELYSK